MRDMKNYIVILPEGLPVAFEVDCSAERAYGAVPKQGSTRAPTVRRAIANLVFRACPNRNDARRISSYLFDEMWECEVYEVPEVSDGDGLELTEPEERRAKEVFLAEAIAKRRNIDELEALGVAKRYLDTLVNRG